MKAAKEELLGERCKNIEKGMIMLGNSKVAFNTLTVFTKTQQHESAVFED